MTVESQPFVSALGRSCTVYVEHENAELYAPSLEHLIVGPPEWGGYLLAPQESTLSERATRDAVSAVFGGHAIQAERHDTAIIVTESSEPVRSGAVNEPPRSDPPRSRGGSSRERGRPGPSPNVAWKRVEQIVKKEIDPEKLRRYTQGDILDMILFLSQKEGDSQIELWQDFAREKAKNSEEPNRPKSAWQNFYSRHKGVIDKCVSIMRSADQSSGNLRQLRDASSSRGPRKSQSRGSGYKPTGSDPESDEEVGMLDVKSHGKTVEYGASHLSRLSEPGAVVQIVKGVAYYQVVRMILITYKALEKKEASVQAEANRNSIEANPPKWQQMEEKIKLLTKSTDEDLLNEKLPPVWKEMCDTFVQERTASNPTRALRDEPKVWTRWAQRHWDVIAAGAIALKEKPYIQANGGQAQLSMTGRSHTPADFDEMADFIAQQIKFRGVSEREQKEVMGQDFIWKAFAIVYRTNRSWEEWQKYYKQKAEDITRAARLRLKPSSQSGSPPAKSLIPQIEAPMALLPSSSGYLSPPVSRLPLKRALDSPTGGTRPKHLRPN
ncbi:hypothetical protein FS837_009482 [Tulasnella sp. UAMH 9824]|nr:hypothetical protein FS837_009482 [Tulasnella sp. UAMH 9824]